MKITTFEEITQAEFKLTWGGQSLVVSIFLIDNMLIDTGPARIKPQLVSLLDQWEFSQVILTHHHEDHTGSAKWIQDHKNVPIYIHESGISNCVDKFRLPLYRKVFWGEREPFQPMAIGDIHQSDCFTWEIIHSPGHAHDHIALYNREKRWMIGGDLFVQTTPKSMFAFESVPVLIETLQKILSYDFDVYICSHAGIIKNGRKALSKKLNYLISIQKEVLTLHEIGLKPKEIQKNMFPNKHLMNYLSLFENSPKHIVNSILKTATL